jgi:hypothetical protein
VSVFVFLGPSLPRERAQSILDAEYLPPVAMGDLYTLVESRAKPGDVVAIVDGLFEQTPAVWHKEILHALASGIHVYGASSMGALRAAELHAFGMQGVGRIFEAYRDGVLEDDDEVVVAHATAEQGYRSLSQAMVSLRFALDALHREGQLTADARAALVQGAKNRHYGDRSWAAVLADAQALGLPPVALQALRERSRRDDAKAEDARELLGRLAALPGEPRPPFVPMFTLEHTSFWAGLMGVHSARVLEARVALRIERPPMAEPVLRRVRAAHPQREVLLRDALLLRLVAAEAASDQGSDPGALRLAAQRLAARNGLSGSRSLAEWRERHQISGDEWTYLLQLESACDRLIERHGSGLDPFLLLALKRAGQYPAVAEAVEQSRRHLERLGIEKVSLDDAGVDPDALQQWYRMRCGEMAPDPERHARSLGFETLRDFVSELLASYIHERSAAAPASAGSANSGD